MTVVNGVVTPATIERVIAAGVARDECIVAPTPVENDAVRGRQCRSVDDVVAGAAVDRDGRGRHARSADIADRDGVAARPQTERDILNRVRANRAIRRVVGRDLDVGDRGRRQVRQPNDRCQIGRCRAERKVRGRRYRAIVDKQQIAGAVRTKSVQAAIPDDEIIAVARCQRRSKNASASRSKNTSMSRHEGPRTGGFFFSHQAWVGLSAGVSGLARRERCLL